MHELAQALALALARIKSVIDSVLCHRLSHPLCGAGPISFQDEEVGDARAKYEDVAPR